MIQFSNEHGKAFEDAFAFAQGQVRKIIEKHPDFYPMYTKNGKWKHEGPEWIHWSDGFFPGLMWLFARRAEPESQNSKFWREQAVRYSKPLEAQLGNPEIHDIGFILYPTYYRWHSLTRDPKINEVLVKAGRNLARHFVEKGLYLRSLTSATTLSIDMMMNVGLVFFAARETGDKRLRDIALRHCFTTRRYLVRGDGSTAHEGIFDPDTGAFVQQSTQQGYRGDSCWSRGLTWALYGFSTAFEYSRDPRFLATAQACADYYISHTPTDGIPPWDFNAPPESRMLLDTSAAAIAASGLHRLCRFVSDPMKGHFYWATAQHILASLCQKHLAKGDAKWEGILKGGVYHLHKELGVDESVMWGEFFFVEGLDRALRPF